MRNLNKVVGIRVTEDFYSKLRTVSNARGEDVSDFIRRSILTELASLNYLSKEQKKALGLERKKERKEQEKLQRKNNE